MSCHKKCYGINNTLNTSWYCLICKLQNTSRDCLLCPVKEGILKPANDLFSDNIKDSTQWVHLTCSLWIPELNVSFENRAEVNFKRINPKRYRLRCTICKVTGKCCIQCANKDCKVAFHVECARSSGYCLNKIENKGRLAYCSDHDPRRTKLKLQEEAAFAYKEILKFSKITLECIKKNTLKRTFHKMNQKILIRRIKKLYGKFVSSDKIEVLYNKLLNERYLWETIKFGGFTGKECYYKFIQIFPDLNKFTKHIDIPLPKENKSELDLLFNNPPKPTNT